MDTIRKNKLTSIARQMRRDVIDMTYSTGPEGAHIGGSLSLVEIFVVLYFDVMRFFPEEPLSPQRDRLILSKGHGSMAMYAALEKMGLYTKEELLRYKKDHSPVTVHPVYAPARGMEFASGSLGQGLSLGVGTCLGFKLKNIIQNVYVIMGDGEINEGSVWEAAASASHYKLDNLTAVIDVNHIQYDGATGEVMDFEPLEDKWKAFGWMTVRVDGHDIEQLSDALHMEHEKPLCILCDTVKGKGVSFAENDYHWHNSALTEELYIKAMEELGGEQE